MRAPTPLGPPILWAEIIAQVQPYQLKAIGNFPKAWVISVSQIPSTES